MMWIEIRFTLNGQECNLLVETGSSLLHVLREQLDLTGAKQACDHEGECGACTVLLDGEAVRSCLTPIEKVAGRSVVTIEGLAAAGKLHPLQQAFIDCGAVQCGFCTPGMILSALPLLERPQPPSQDEIVEALAGNLCRCTGYAKIVEAVEMAARLQAAAPHASGGVVTAARGGISPGPLVGGSQARVDGVDKVTGAARYAEDIKMPGLLHAALVRSPIPHGRVVSLDTVSARQVPGVVSILTAADIPGLNSLEGYSRNEPLLVPVGERVRMIGDAVAIVVAGTPEAATAGANAVLVDYNPLAHTYDAAEAIQPDAILVRPSSPPGQEAPGNVLNSHAIRFGDLVAAWAGSDLVLETHFGTPYMEHSALERETVLSYVSEPSEGTQATGGLLQVTVVAGHQEPHWAQAWIARALALPQQQVRVITPHMGGAFGGKQDPWPLMAGALAAYHVRRPVRLTYTRRESFHASPKRHPYQMAFKLGARADGTLTANQLRIVANTGAHDSDGYFIPYYALVAGGGPYRWDAVHGFASVVYTNGPKSGQMRGFGTPQAAFGLECSLDELADRLGVDPLDLRLRNAIDGDSVTFLGGPVAETVGYRECLQALEPYYRQALSVAKQTMLDRQGSSNRWRCGVGVAGMWYRFGKCAPISCEAQAELGLDGEITFYFSAPDYGQGTTTVMAQFAAEALGLPRASLRLVNADTALTPDSGIQGASRSTYWVGGAVAEAARNLKARILAVASEILGAGVVAPNPPQDRAGYREPQPGPQLDIPQDGCLQLEAGAVHAPEGIRVSLPQVAAEMERRGLARRVTGVFSPALPSDVHLDRSSGNLPFFITGAHLAEVDVNVETGEVRVSRVVAVHDVGRVVNPQGAQGQIEGAVLMSLGAALMEEYVPGVSTGFRDYYLPTLCETPKIEVLLIEVPSRWGPLGAKGLGEGAVLPTAPAILNAVFRACGARVRQLPATPERVLAALEESRVGDVQGLAGLDLVESPVHGHPGRRWSSRPPCFDLRCVGATCGAEPAASDAVAPLRQSRPPAPAD